ncbi:Rho GTPase-activating protein 15 [Pteropus alecto]|uniref:Rho GTPase-activating protein 15 n=1 Tax=Pteropus alecto TaxID=9402 RepID=L5JZS9_PTEAL|nr:Rho GTPase-activating protein 15 [Pteropus alecto]
MTSRTTVRSEPQKLGERLTITTVSGNEFLLQSDIDFIILDWFHAIKNAIDRLITTVSGNEFLLQSDIDFIILDWFHAIKNAIDRLPKNPSSLPRNLELFKIQRSSSTELLSHYDSDIKEQKPEHRKSLSLDVDGIYRVSGNLATIQKLRFIVNQEKQDNNTRIETVKSLVQKLPPPNRDTMKVLFGHLTKIVAKASKNLMSTQSLGIVFGPTLLRAEHETGNMAIHMVYQNQIAELMLSEYSKIFGSEED